MRKILADALVASTNGGKVHKLTCKMVENMNADNKVYFKDAAEAKKAGYDPCKICFKDSPASK